MRYHLNIRFSLVFCLVVIFLLLLSINAPRIGLALWRKTPETSATSEFEDEPLPDFHLLKNEVPVVIVDEHQEVIPWWYNGVENGLLKKHGNTLIHIDAHSDFSPPEEYTHIAFFQHVFKSRPSSFLPLMESNDVFIVSAILQGLINKVIWIRPNWIEGESNELSKSYVGFNVTRGVRRVCVCHQQRHNARWLPGECYMFNRNDQNDTNIPPSYCKAVKKFKFIMMGEDDVIPLLKLKNINSAILDIDEDYFGVQSGVGHFITKGVSEAIQRKLDGIFNAIFCLQSLQNEHELNIKVKNLFMKLASLKAQGELNAKNFKEELMSNVEFYLCKSAETLISHFYNVVSQITVRELASLTQLNYCLESKYSCLHISNKCFGVCHGTIFPRDTLNQIYVGDLDGIKARGAGLTNILTYIMKSVHLGFVTIARSLRDGYTPRTQQRFIESTVLSSLKKSMKSHGFTASLFYNKQLFGEYGWKVK